MRWGVQFAIRGGISSLKKPMLLSPGLRRSTAVLAVTSVLVAGVVVFDRDDTGGVGLSALPGATGQPAPTGPTGGPGGGSGGAPPFPMQPPEMPSGPPNGYNSGSYPAPDQGNGISIYNSGAPQGPGSQNGYQQGSNDSQQLQPANGSQPPDYDAPLQTAAQPSVAPSPAPHTAAPQQPQPSQDQHQPTDQPQQPNNDQLNQKQQQCQAAMAELGNAASNAPAVVIGGGGRSIHFKLDPAPPPPPSCPGGCPTTAQPQPAPSQPPATLTPQQLQQAQQDAYKQGLRDATKCDGFTKFENISGLVVSSFGVVASVAGAPFSGGWSLVGIPPAFTGMMATWDNLRKCSN